jgi:CheY-like chemotaxis protein
MGRRWWILAAVVTVVVLAGCDDVNTVERASTPVVLSGAEVGGLIGEDPDDIVAFSHNRFRESDVWRQIPVQVDERKVVGFGSQPSNNTTAGVTGTVYGSGSAGVTALQYADPTTFVGSDDDAAFDADDEVVFMLEDGGGKPRPNELSEPTGVVSGSGVQVQIDDPLGDDDTAWVYVCADRPGGALHRQERPDLVLIDLSMPDMDGFEAASEIMRLQDGDAVKAPIVAMTAHPALTHRNRCLEAGFSGFLEKPATFDKVEKTLSPFLAPGSTPHSDPTGDKP